MNGLYDGDFVGYRVASSEERDAALREAVVAIDANVLLDLYRFRPQTSQDLIKTLQSLGDRLVVPHQALREFWRHRQRSQASPRAATAVATEALGKAGRAMTSALSIWAKQVGVDDSELNQLTQNVNESVTALQSELEKVLKGAEGRPDRDTILEQLEALLAGRVTSPLPEQEWEECVAEAHRRITAEEPPGYKDAAKEDGDAPEGGAGDYLVWYQATRYAQAQERDLVIVTRDEKEDWWWRRQSELVGPRPELVLEFHQLCGRRLFLMRPFELLARASVLQVEVDLESSLEVSRVAVVAEEVPPAPWTLAAVSALLEVLDEQAPVQAAALRLATPAQGGRVLREQVYELGGYSDDRMLRGFTKPYRRLTETLQADGLIPVGVRPILEARYPYGVKASYFSVPPEVPPLLETIADSSRDGGTAAD